MGRYKPQTRFIVETGGRPRLLFTVRDNAPDGSLHIRFPELPYRKPNDAEAYGVKAAHHTVHPSPRHRGNIVNMTTDTAHGDEIVNRLECQTPSPMMIVPLIGRRQWHYQDEQFVPRLKDKMVHIRTFNQDHNTLLFAVWAVAKGLKLPPVAFPFSRYRAEFRYFALVVYYTTVPVRAYPDGDTIGFQTHSPRINEGLSNVLVTNARPRGRDVLPVMDWLVNRLANRFMRLFDDADLSDAGEIAELRKLAYMFGGIALVKGEEACSQRAAAGSIIVRPTINFRYSLTPKGRG